MAKKEKFGAIVSINQCARYSFGIIKNTTIKEVLTRNSWIFGESWNFWSYCTNAESIKVSPISADPFVDDKYILFCNDLHKFGDWENIVNWDSYGAWYSYNYPTLIPRVKETLLLSNEYELPVKNADSGSKDSSSLGKAWQFIHYIRPDVFVIKKGSDVVIGASDFHAIWLLRQNLVELV